MQKLAIKQIITVIAIGLAGLFLINSIFYLPLLKKNKEAGLALKKSRVKYQAINEISQNPKQFEQNSQRLKNLDLLLEEKLPTERMIPELGNLLNNAAKESGVAVESITSGTVLESQLNIPSQQNSLQISFEILPVNVIIKTDTKGLVKFIYWLNNQKRFLKLERLTVIPHQLGGNLISATFSLNAFTLPKKGYPFLALDEDNLSIDKDKLAKIFSVSKTQDNKQEFDNIKDIIITKKTEVAVSREGLNLSGIVSKPEKGSSIAIINGKFLREGAKVSDCMVKSIEKDKVVLDCAGQPYELTLKKKAKK